jgi:hypothetical protein
MHEDEAMERYAGGDDAAFGALYEAIAPRLLGDLKKVTGRDEDAHDLLAQTMLEIHRARASYIPGAAVLPWAGAIAQRLATGELERSRRAPTVAERGTRAARRHLGPLCLAAWATFVPVPHGAGTIVGDRYELVRPLGEGGMGVVWEATHTTTHASVAVKLLKPSVWPRRDLRARFVREARAARAVRHPNVTQIHEVLELEDGAPAIVMELLEGETLAQRLRRSARVPLAEMAPILLAVVSALEAAHAAGIVHRDLKPDNIFLSKRGVQVLDFGVAKMNSFADVSDAAITPTGAMLGTPHYMSPEQVFAEKDVDHRADVWALGVLIYECLAGVRPTDAPNVGQIIKRITQDDLPPLAEAAPWVPADVCRLVTRMLSRQRDRRPSLASIKRVLERAQTASAYAA